jgi:hypothetical protein
VPFLCAEATYKRLGFGSEKMKETYESEKNNVFFSQTRQSLTQDKTLTRHAHAQNTHEKHTPKPHSQTQTKLKQHKETSMILTSTVKMTYGTL